MQIFKQNNFVYFWPKIGTRFYLLLTACSVIFDLCTRVHLKIHIFQIWFLCWKISGLYNKIFLLLIKRKNVMIKIATFHIIRIDQINFLLDIMGSITPHGTDTSWYDALGYVTSRYRRFVVPTPRGNDTSGYRRFVVPILRGTDTLGYWRLMVRQFGVPTLRGTHLSTPWRCLWRLIANYNIAN